MSEKLRKLKDKASIAFGEGKLKDALKAYAAIVEEDPTEIACRIKIGDIHRRLGQKREAVAAYEPVARHYAEDGLLLKAIAVCKLILSVDATHTKTQDMLANLYSTRTEPKSFVPVAPPRKKEADIEIDESEEMVIERSATDSQPVAPAPVQPLARPAWPPAPSAPAPAFSWPVSQFTAPPPPVPVIKGEKIEEPKVQVIMGAKVAAEPEIAIEEPVEEPVIELEHPAQPQVIQAEEQESLESLLDVAQARNKEGLESLAHLEEDGAIDTTPRYGESRPIELSRTLRGAHRPAMATETDDLGGGLALPQIPLFSDLPKDAFIEILVQMTMRELQPGEHVIREGDIGDAFYVIASGKVRVARKNHEGGETVLAYLTEGAFFGEMALLQDGARTASVIVEEDSQIFEINRGVLDRVVAQYPSVARVLRNFYTQRLLSTTMATHAIFRPFSAEQRRDLMEKFRSRMFKAGDVLVKEGNKGEGLYLLLTGALEVSKMRENQPFVIAELGTGDVFGEMSLLMNRPTIATVTATKDSFVLRLAKKDFDELIMTHPQILELVAQISEERETENTAIFAGWDGSPEVGAALV